jgi:hypothetical protein
VITGIDELLGAQRQTTPVALLLTRHAIVVQKVQRIVGMIWTLAWPCRAGGPDPANPDAGPPMAIQRPDPDRAQRGQRSGMEASPVTGEYDLRPFREAFERSGLSITEVARRLDWTCPDQDRAGRTLGLHRDHGKYRQRLCHHTALALCKALDIDPVDVGL